MPWQLKWDTRETPGGAYISEDSWESIQDPHNALGNPGMQSLCTVQSIILNRCIQTHAAMQQQPAEAAPLACSTSAERCFTHATHTVPTWGLQAPIGTVTASCLSCVTRSAETMSSCHTSVTQYQPARIPMVTKTRSPQPMIVCQLALYRAWRRTPLISKSG